MHVPRTVSLLFVVAATIGLLVGASPVAAYRLIEVKGNVGTFGLTDTRRSPGADCLYRFSDRRSAWVLRRINIDPPNADAHSFEGNQQVGWKFTIERQTVSAFSEEPGPWEHRYTSPVMKATADFDHDAPFSPMGVRVFVPDSASADVEYFYRAIVKVIWYRPNGSVSGTGRLRVEWFKSFIGNDSDKQRWSCTGHIY